MPLAGSRFQTLSLAGPWASLDQSVLDTLRTSVAGVEGESNFALDNLLATSSDPRNMVGAHLALTHIWPSPAQADLPPETPTRQIQRAGGLLYSPVSQDAKGIILSHILE